MVFPSPVLILSGGHLLWMVLIIVPLMCFSLMLANYRFDEVKKDIQGAVSFFLSSFFLSFFRFFVSPFILFSLSPFFLHFFFLSFLNREEEEIMASFEEERCVYDDSIVVFYSFLCLHVLLVRKKERKKEREREREDENSFPSFFLSFLYVSS
jgi:hypothetical protein